MSVSVTHGGLHPPALVRARSPAGGIATFAMHKRTRTKSGGCESAVRLRIAWRHDYVHIRTQSCHAAPRAAGVNPPCGALTHLQWRFGNCRKTVVGALANAVAITLPQPLL